MVFEADTFSEAWRTAQLWENENEYTIVIGQHTVDGRRFWVTEIHWTREYWEWKKNHPSQYK